MAALVEDEEFAMPELAFLAVEAQSLALCSASTWSPSSNQAAVAAGRCSHHGGRGRFDLFA